MSESDGSTDFNEAEKSFNKKFEGCFEELQKKHEEKHAEIVKSFFQHRR